MAINGAWLAPVLPVQNAHLQIIWDASSDSIKTGSSATPNPPLPNSASLAASCANIAAALAPGTGIYGIGAFSSFSCVRDTKFLSGSHSSGPWRLLLRLSRGKLLGELEFDYLGDPDLAVPVGGKIGANFRLGILTLPRAALTGLIANDPTTLALFTTELYRSLPMRLVVPPTPKTTPNCEDFLLPYVAPVAAEGDANPALATPPKEFQLYRLAVNPRANTFSVVLEGTAELRQENGWSISPSACKALAHGPLFGISLAETPSETQANSSTLALKNYFKNLDLAALLRQLTQGYRIEMRYSLPLVTDAVLLPKTRLINLVGESQRGATAGLRGYLDYVKPVTDQIDGKLYEFGWQRFALSWALSFKPGLGIDRIDIAPKLGFWHLRMVLPGLTDSDPPRTFNIAYRQGIGVDAGIEKNLGNFSLRLWQGRDETISFLGKGNGGARSQRFGLDATIAAANFSFGSYAFKPVFGAFLLSDSMFVTSGDPAAVSLLRTPRLASTGQPDQIFIDLYYVGVGLGLTW